MRSLSPDEARLWAQVTATTRPLSRDPIEQQASEKPSQTPPSVDRAASARKPPLAVPAARPGGPGITLDSGWDKRLRGGSIEPDRVLDLHGMNLDRAWQAIDFALERSISAGERVLLLITGHHRAGERPVERGRIRAAVHDWLAASRHASDIAAVRGAHRRHGGGGSLYIVLRRKRRR